MPQNDLEEAFINKNITYSDWKNKLTNYDENDINDAMFKLGLMVNGHLNNEEIYLNV